VARLSTPACPNALLVLALLFVGHSRLLLKFDCPRVQPNVCSNSPQVVQTINRQWLAQPIALTDCLQDRCERLSSSCRRDVFKQACSS